MGFFVVKFWGNLFCQKKNWDHCYRKRTIKGIRSIYKSKIHSVHVCFIDMLKNSFQFVKIMFARLVGKDQVVPCWKMFSHTCPSIRTRVNKLCFTQQHLWRELHFRVWDNFASPPQAEPPPLPPTPSIHFLLHLGSNQVDNHWRRQLGRWEMMINFWNSCFQQWIEFTT